MTLGVLILVWAIIGATQNPGNSVLHREQLTDPTRGNWQFIGTNAVVVGSRQSQATAPNGENTTDFTVSARFNTLNSDVYAVYTFNSPVNLTRHEEIYSWLNANADVGKVTGGYSPPTNGSFSYGIFLYDSAGNWKGLRHAPIVWRGWNELVLPTNFVPNDASSNWKDNTSLGTVKAIRLYFQPENHSDNNSHDITFTLFETLDIEQSTATDALGFATSYLIVILIFVSPVFFVLQLRRHIPSSSGVGILSMLRPIATSNGMLVYVGAVVIKSILVMLTPLSSDFIDISYRFAPAIPFPNIFTTSIAGGSIWVSFMNAFYGIWMIMPVDHPSLREIFPGNISYPISPSPVFHFLSTPGTLIFLLVTKSLLLFFDLGLGFLTFAIVQKLRGSSSAAMISFVAWTLNPLSTLTGIIFGGVDLIMTFFLLLSVYLIELQRKLPAALAYGVSVGTKLFPGVLLPLMILIGLRKNGASNSQQSISKLVAQQCVFVLTSALTVGAMILPSITYGGNKSALPTFGQVPDFAFFYGPLVQVFGTTIGLTPLLYILVLFVAVYGERARSLSSPEIILLGFLALFAFSRLFPQFMIWVIPFVLISAAIRGHVKLFISFTFLTLAYVLYYFGPYFTTWGNSFLFHPISSPELQGLSSALEFIQGRSLSVMLNLDALFGSLFSGFCLGYMYIILRSKKVNA